MIDKEQEKNRTGQVVKKFIKMSMKPLLIGIGIFLVAVIIFSAVTWFLKKLDTKEDPNNPKNAPAAVRNFMNNTKIDKNGTITSGKSIQEFWDELKQSGNRATAYLNSAEELGKLVYAARALDYPDTRENPDDTIKWNELDINSKEIQGIVKFKRALADGENITMTYVSPSKLKELINKYKSTGNESDRQEALKHFTVEKSYSASTNTRNNNDIAKVESLKGMVFMGDSILSTFNEFKKSELKDEGAILMYKSGCNAKYFTGRGTVNNSDYNTIETANGHFDWNANFQRVTNPTGFYLMLGQNALFNDDRIEEIDELVKIIKSKYPAKPIYISSVLHYIDSDGSAEEKATSMNEELKVYCEGNNGVYYSDILRGYNNNLEAMTKDDNDHPNSQGVQVLLNNIKQNIIQTSSTNSTSNTSSTSSSKTGSSTSQVVAPIDDFSEETRQIIMSHINDFNENNYRSFIENYPGGYDGYMQSLGGVFAKYGGKGNTIEINNAGDLQDAAEFVWGLMSIWGFDYWNDSSYYSWGEDEEFDGLHDSRYYTVHSYASSGDWDQGNMNDLCSNPNSNMRTNCNAGIDSFLWTTNLENDGYATRDRNGEKIERKEDLQVGDLVHFYHNSDETDWGHVAIVGEIDPNTGDVIMYDSGNRFIRTGRYKIPLSLEPGGAYDNYEKWVGRRHYDIDQSTNRTASNSRKRNTTYKVKVATWSEYLDKVESNDSEVNKYNTGIEYNMTTTTIPYQSIVSKYKMPFNYLWTMLVYSNDKNYTFDLADLVKNSKIEITVHDNLNETTNVVTDTYTDYTKIHAEADVDIAFDQVNQVINKDIDPITKKQIITKSEVITDGKTTEHGVADGEKWNPYYVIHTTVNKTNTLDIALTLADAWCARYEKKYTYNEPQETENNSSSNLDDIPKKPYTRNGELGGLEEKVDQNAVEQANASDRRNVHATGERENEIANYQTTRITRVKSTYTKIKTSSYTAVPGKNVYGSSVTTVSTPKTGQLNKDNYVEFAPHKQGDANNHQQGFCFAGDDLIVYAINHLNNTCSIYLIDANTMQEYDSYHDLKDHGNSIAYDSKTGDIIFPEVGVMKLISINKVTKKFENVRTQSLPEYERNTSSIAYNESNDLFISKENVYTRQSFYSNGKPLRKMKNTPPSGNLNISGCTTFGNQVYYYYTEPNYSKNYFVVCNINSGQQEEVITDNMDREGEEASFTKDGTLYICYGYGKKNGKVTGSSFQKTDYNYYADSNIDKSNVSSGNGNEIAQYTTGGDYSENLYFQKVFNSHYNGRSNILSAKEWLYGALEQNEDTVNMIDITKYLIARAQGAEENEEEFLAALEKLSVYDMTQVGTETGGLLSITSTTFTREQFIQLVQSYSAAISKGSGTKDFRDNAGVVYDVCKKNNINPVLCAAQAWKEQNWVYPSTSKYNYWGIAVYNGQNYGSSYSSMEAAVENYCKNINQRLKGENGAAKWSKICAQYNNKFTGGINNLYDVLSNWACVDNADSNPSGQAKHASEYVDSVVKCATQIFGEGALTASGGGGNFLTVAQNIWKKICNGNYSYGGSSIPCTGTTVDCSSYVSWVLYEYGYTDFKGGQHCTQQFKNTNWNQKYGWTEINVGGGQNPYNSIQPGDLFVRDPGNNNGHITLVVRKENGKIYCYDCGNSKNWRNNPNAEALDKSYMLTDSRSGKIIRVTPKQ